VRREPPFAKAYARALHDLARERGQVETIARELDEVAQVVADDVELRQFFARPWIGATAKRQVAVEVANRSGMSALMRDFLGLVARQGRAEHLDAIASAFRRLIDEQHGRVRAQVRTAVPLSADDRQALREHLARALGRRSIRGGTGARALDVVVEDVVDPQLLGGFVAEIGSYIVDGSLDGQLAQLKQRLAQG
jgi:F-type H+-transporting ATPase subunit delta